MHNLKKLREDGADDTIIRSINTVWFEFCEQDAVNSVCKRHFLELPQAFNAMRFSFPQVPEEDVIIKHYAARHMPLNTNEDYRYYEQFSWDQILDHKKGVHTNVET